MQRVMKKEKKKGVMQNSMIYSINQYVIDGGACMYVEV